MVLILVKILLRKLKKANKFMLGTYIFTTIAYLISFAFLVKNLLSLAGIETTLRIVFIIIFSILIIIYFIWNLINIILKRKKTFIVTTILFLILTIVFGIGSYAINFVYNQIGNVGEKETVVYTTYLIALKDTKITDDSKLGMMSDESNIEWNILPKELIEKEKLNNEIIDYEDNFIMLHDLYNGTVDGIFVSSNYLTLYGNEEAYENISVETYVVYEHSKEMKNQDLELASTKTLDEPFTVLLMGVDSKTEGLNANAAFNGDTLMLITFNPHTLSATVFSIPRDTYVPIACNNNKYAKINSSAAYGTSCVIDTVEQLTDIEIDYYAKINFKGVVALVDALGGIDVLVTKEFCEQNSDRSFAEEDLICLEEGFQHLDGEQTLAYARHRKTLLRSDIDRTKNQQLIVEAMAKKALTISSFEDFENILNAVSSNIATNMSEKQILSSYDILKKMLSNSLNDEDFIKIEKTYLEYYSLPVYTSNMYTSAIGHYEGSLDAIKKAMKVNLELEEPEVIKTFKYSYNEAYESKLIGQGITTGEKLTLVPSFIGQTASYVRDWGNQNGINIIVDGSESGTVTSQNIHDGVLVKSISSITITTSGYTTPIESAPIPNTSINNNSNTTNNTESTDTENTTTEEETKTETSDEIDEAITDLIS